MWRGYSISDHVSCSTLMDRDLWEKVLSPRAWDPSLLGGHRQEWWGTKTVEHGVTTQIYGYGSLLHFLRPDGLFLQTSSVSRILQSCLLSSLKDTQMSLPLIEICTRTKLSRQKKKKKERKPLKEEFLCCEWFILKMRLRKVLEIFIQWHR